MTLDMLLDLLQALDLVKMLRLLLPLEDLHLNLWNRMSLVNLRMELGQGMQKGMALDHEGTNLPIDLAKMMPMRLLVLVLLPMLL
jgi:hypothetical protein